MQDEKIVRPGDDTASLSNELTFRRYIMAKDQLRKLFKEISMSEYIALHIFLVYNEFIMIFGRKTKNE